MMLTSGTKTVTASRELEATMFYIVLQDGRKVDAKKVISILLPYGRVLEGYMVDKGANHFESAVIQAKLGLTTPMYQDVIPALARNPEQKKRIRNEYCYVDGVGINKDGIFAFDKRGELVKPVKNTDPGGLVLVHPGNRQLALFIRSESETAFHGNGFCIGGNDWKPSYTVKMVFGTRVATPKILRLEKDEALDIVQLPDGATEFRAFKKPAA